jgi:hypothetical protein
MQNALGVTFASDAVELLEANQIQSTTYVKLAALLSHLKI